MILYNQEPPNITKVDPQTCLNSYTSRNYRLANIDKVYEKEKGLRKLLDFAPIIGSYKKVLIDVKGQDLDPKQYTCVNKSWHLDGRLTIKHKSHNDNTYHIITWGGAPTLFIKYPITSLFSGIEQNLLAKLLDLDSEPFQSVNEFEYNTYGEYHWHKCGRAIKHCKRTFIRIIESDYIKAEKIN